MCSKGWGYRCPASRGPRCTCSCGGACHGHASALPGLDAAARRVVVDAMRKDGGLPPAEHDRPAFPNEA